MDVFQKPTEYLNMKISTKYLLLFIMITARIYANEPNYSIIPDFGKNQFLKTDKWLECVCLQNTDRISFFHVSLVQDKELKITLVADVDPKIEILENDTWQKLPHYKKELIAICPYGLFVPFVTGTPGMGVSSFFISRETISKRLYDYFKNNPAMSGMKYHKLRILKAEYELNAECDNFKERSQIVSREIIISVKKINNKTETVEFE